MARWRDHINNNLDVAISVPAILCFIQFVSGLVGVFRTGSMDSSTFNQLLSSADGFESVVLFTVVATLKYKKK